MVKITNGTNVYEVTKGAYEGIYRYQGYQVIDGEKEQQFDTEFEAKGERSADELFVEELEKKPISQWGRDEVKHYAAIKDIDLTGTKSANEAKELIKKVMNGEE